jgi:adenosylcobinamide-phosphate synthase
MGLPLLGWLPLAVAMDLALGEPPAVFHPVVWMGRVISFCERFAPSRGRLSQLLAGAAIALGVPTGFALIAARIESWSLAHGVAGVLAGALALKTTFALRALGRAAREVRDRITSGRIHDARKSLRALCSRNPDALDESALLAATIESAAENASDSFVAPLFWFSVLGLPGAFFYRAVNTIDAMIGYRGHYEWLGKVPARLDDVLNWVPARLTACLMLAGGAMTGLDARRGARTLARDGARTQSPNAGLPMAAMAGLLGVELEKPGQYRLGERIESLDPAHVDRAWHAVLATAALAVVLSSSIVEARLAFSR